jgi:hypothetical protein
MSTRRDVSAPFRHRAGFRRADIDGLRLHDLKRYTHMSAGDVAARLG